MDFPITNEFFQEEAITTQAAKQMLVLASRVLAKESICDAYGHVSVRNPEAPERFIISRALAPELVTLDDLIEMDLNGKVTIGKDGYRPFSESAIHYAIYAARPDINCICHAHPHEIIPFTCSDTPLRSMYHLDVTFFEGVPVYSDIAVERGLLLNTREEGEKLAKTLGNKRGALIRNHGMVVVGESIPRAVFSSITMRDGAAILQKTLSMGIVPRSIGCEEAEYGTYIEFCGQGLQRAWDYWCNRARQTYSDIADLYVTV